MFKAPPWQPDITQMLSTELCRMGSHNEAVHFKLLFTQLLLLATRRHQIQDYVDELQVMNPFSIHASESFIWAMTTQSHGALYFICCRFNSFVGKQTFRGIARCKDSLFPFYLPESFELGLVITELMQTAVCFTQQKICIKPPEVALKYGDFRLQIYQTD